MLHTFPAKTFPFTAAVLATLRLKPAAEKAETNGKRKSRLE